MLAHEKLMAEVMKLRQPSEPQAKSKPMWLLFMESSGAVALITVLIGGILGSIISARFQESQKDREFQLSWLKSQGEMALAASKEYRDRELEIISQAYELIGRCIAVSDDLIYLTNPVFDPSEYTDDPDAKTQRQAMRNNYNNCAKEWSEKQEKLGLLMGYYHHGQPTVVSAWQDVKDSVKKYMDCSHQWYLEHIENPTATEGVCKEQRDNYVKRVEQLNVSLSEARRHLWEGWESPEKLREALDKEH